MPTRTDTKAAKMYPELGGDPFVPFFGGGEGETPVSMSVVFAVPPRSADIFVSRLVLSMSADVCTSILTVTLYSTATLDAVTPGKSLFTASVSWLVSLISVLIFCA